MADVTISSLPIGTPSGNLIVPISDGINTFGAPLSNIQVDYNSLTNKPTIPTNTGLGGIQFFTETSNFTVPSDVTKIKITAVGGGGGGGRSGNFCPGGTAGGDSFITGIDLRAGGGAGFVSGCGGSVGSQGIASGALAAIKINGVSSSTIVGWNPFGNVGGTIYGRAGKGTDQYGQSGGFAIGVATVTPNQQLTVNVGAAGGNGYGTTTQLTTQGAVLIEW